MSWLTVSGVIALAIGIAIAILWWDSGRRRTTVEGWSSAIARRASFESGGEGRFTLDLLDPLPEPARRYLHWSIDEGTPLARGVRLKMVGRIRLGRGKPWIPLVSEETLGVNTGFVWRARTTGGMPISGFDRYLDGHGEMHWRLFGLLPVMTAAGDDITRSSRWRYAAEHVLAPSLLVPRAGVLWQADGDHAAIIRVDVDGESHQLHLSMDAEGMPRKLSMERWGNVETPDGAWQAIPYAVRMEGVFRKDGYSLPHQMQASWWAGTDKELAVVELEIEDASFF